MNTCEQLHRAKKVANDEYLTKYEDVCAELKHYPRELFEGKRLILPADSPKSAFWEYFAIYSNWYKFKSVQAIHYQPGMACGISYFLSPETGFGFDAENFTYDGELKHIQSLIDTADVVVTNPPFSLFRQFYAAAKEKQFLLLAPVSSLGYKEIANDIIGGKTWVGADGYGQGGRRIFDTDRGPVALKNSIWLTNMVHDRITPRYVDCRTRKENRNLFHKRSFTRTWKDYPKYDNLDAIEVGCTEFIPSDYDGIMGVPLTFLLRYNPSQFEIVGFRYGDDGQDLKVNGAIKWQRYLIRHRR